MRYSEASSLAPAGSAHFQPEDLARLPSSSLAFLLSPGPAAPPLEDVAAALQGSPHALAVVAASLPGDRAERLLRLGQRRRKPAATASARASLVRGLFWPLVYELLPERWDELARAEPVHPALIEALPKGCEFVVEVAAGTGRLTARLLQRTRRLLAIEPCLGLRRILAARLAGAADVVAGRAPHLPVAAGCADLVVACSAFGPDAPWGGEAVLADLERCARPGGTVAFVGADDPGWFERLGYSRTTFDPGQVAVAATPVLVEFFGPLTPPHELLLKTV